MSDTKDKENRKDAVGFVNYKIKQRKVMLFSKNYSPECKEVKSILNSFHMKSHIFEVCEINGRQDCTQIENYFLIICLTNAREVCNF